MWGSFAGGFTGIVLAVNIARSGGADAVLGGFFGIVVVATVATAARISQMWLDTKDLPQPGRLFVYAIGVPGFLVVAGLIFTFKVIEWGIKLLGNNN